VIRIWQILNCTFRGWLRSLSFNATSVWSWGRGNAPLSGWGWVIKGFPEHEGNLNAFGDDTVFLGEIWYKNPNYRISRTSHGILCHLYWIRMFSAKSYKSNWFASFHCSHEQIMFKNMHWYNAVSDYIIYLETDEFLWDDDGSIIYK